MGLVGYQVQKENEENEKRLKQLQELATSVALKKQEKKKANPSLPMRGRHMHIGDKTREQAMRCEVFKQENENKEVQLRQNSAVISEQMRRFEESLLERKQRTVSQHLSYVNVLRQENREPEITNSQSQNPLKEFKSLKATTFLFDGKFLNCFVYSFSYLVAHHSAMAGSALDINSVSSPQDADQGRSAASGFADFYNNIQPNATTTGYLKNRADL
jgi:hypothetical protein